MDLNINERALAYGALHEKQDAAIRYVQDPSGERRLENILESDSDFYKLAMKFKQDPQFVLGYIRLNMFSISGDEESKKTGRLKQFIPDYFKLMCLLDRCAFPSTGNRVISGIPEYVPDGLSDMGQEESLQTVNRDRREKIRVRKAEIFDQASELFYDVFTAKGIFKQKLMEMVGKWVTDKVPFDNNHRKRNLQGTVNLDHAFSPDGNGFGVCRHQALYTQVLNQALGIKSLLMKCYLFNGGVKGGHAANLVRLDKVWYILDVTIPIVRGREKSPCLWPVPETEIDLNKKTYKWEVEDDFSRRTYMTRNNMFYRIADNRFE